MIKSLSKILAVAALAVPFAASATIFQFTASLNGANEVQGSANQGFGSASLKYYDQGTPSLADDRFDFVMSAIGLGSAATAYHIHGAATVTENAPVRIGLDAAPFVTLVNAGGTLVVTGNNVVAPVLIAATGTGPFAGVANAGHPAMSFLQMLQSGLAYVNVHTAAQPSGAIRGQLVQVAAIVPEPETYGMMLVGIALMGVVVRRRKQA